MKAITATLALFLASGPGPGRAEEVCDDATPSPTPSSISGTASSGTTSRPRLTLNLPLQAAATGGMLLLGGLSQLEANRLAAPACRWCDQPQIDRWARRELRWNDVKAAGTISDVLVIVIPAGAALTLGFSARADGAGTREVSEDLLMVTEAAAAAVLLTQASKLGTGRLRPDSWARGGGTTADGRMSFWGGHSAFAFSVAAGATQVARLRGRAGWKWLAVVSFAGATATAWLRVSADRHWLTDVVVGAGVGTAVGLAVPLLVLRPASERATAVTLVPAPGGLALVF